MQREEVISRKGVDILIETIFADEMPVVYEAYSKFGEEIVSFDNSIKLSKYIHNGSLNNEFMFFAIYYPQTGGFLRKGKVNIDSKQGNKKNSRFTINGCGLIYFQLDFKILSQVSCRFAVNSEKRANKWFDSDSDHDSPNN